MCEKTEDEILPHHVQQSLCTTRLPYRQGRKLTAVKVYTINNESKHLLIFGVPSLNLRQETKSLFLKFGKLLQFNVTTYPSEQFTETYHALFENISSARMAKRKLDTINFYGGSLHVTYAPELETVEETREKILHRRNNVIARLKNLEKDGKEILIDEKIVTNEEPLNMPKSVNVPIKLYMGDVNHVNMGKKKDKSKKITKSFQPYNNCNPKSTKHKKIGSTNYTKSTDEDRTITTENYILEYENEKLKSQSIGVIDFISTENETLSNINEALNYNKFGNEIIKQVPHKPLNKIKFNINKNPD